MRAQKAAFALCITAALFILFGGPVLSWMKALYMPYFEGRLYYDLAGLPVSMGGRVMPLSSASADVLRLAHGSSSFRDADGRRVDSTQWIWRLNADFEGFSKLPIFRTDSRDIQKLLGAQGRYLSLEQLEARHDGVVNLAHGGGPSSKAAAELVHAGTVYGLAGMALGFSHADSSPLDFAREWSQAVLEARAELDSSKAEKRQPDREKLRLASGYLKSLREAEGFEAGYKNYLVRAVPGTDGGEWMTSASALLKTDLSRAQNEVLTLYAALLDDISAGDEARAKAHVDELKGALRAMLGAQYSKCGFENFFNMLDPFFAGLPLYGAALLLLFAALLCAPRARRVLFACALLLTLFGLLAHSFGIGARIYIQMRPPVTNLYSSIVFVGWGAALAAFWMSLKGRSFIYAFSAAFAGFISLLIALNMPHSGDTMGMMRAVLNSNFWLSAHVLTIVVGYCGVFLAGFMSALRLVVYGIGRVNFTKENSEDFLKSVYSVLCFSLLFSFAGTMLGGIWADMSWGRFWGWDPKENGALMIILWSAAAIHARHLHLVSARTFLAMCVFGGVIAAWAWFGVNMLGIGLHAYGFFSGGWLWFGVFAASQVLIALLAFLPEKKEPGA